MNLACHTERRRLYRYFGAVIIGLALCGVSPMSVRAEATAMDWSGVLRSVLPAVVNISVETLVKDSKTGEVSRHRQLGSGFLVDPNGTILTNRHVIQGAFRITVITNDRLRWRATPVAAAKLIDVAVLRIDTGQAMPYLKFATSDPVEVGDPVLVIGNPVGIGTSVSAGIISGLNRNLMNTPFDDYIQTDAAINHGNSGGPVINHNGNVVGIATILITAKGDEGSNGLGFAIPGSDASYAVRHLLDPKSAPVGWIGVHVQDVSPNLARSFGLNQAQGFLITEVEPGSPAEVAGLHAGDVVLRFGTDTPTDSRALMRDIVFSPLGTEIFLTVETKGKTRDIKVTVKSWPDLHESIAELTSPPDLVAEARPPDLGLIYTPLTPAARRIYQATEPDGVLVAAVDPASQAYAEGIVAGDVIEQVENTPVRTADDVEHAVQSAERVDGFVAFLIKGKTGTRWTALYAGRRSTPLASSAPSPIPETANALTR